jgi:hypothetical protein
MAAKATPAQVKAFFEADGGRKVTSAELMALKKTTVNGVVTEHGDYDQIAYGIGDGSFTY